MEIRLSGGPQRRVYEKTSPAGSSAGSSSGGSRTAAAKEDRLSLSEQAAAFLREQNRQMQEDAIRDAEQKNQEDSDALDLLAKALKAMKQCAEIARRIQAGDKVPPEDKEFLMNNDPAGYKLAMATRKVKKDPKKWESVLDPEENTPVQEESGDSEAVSAAGGAESGGGAGMGTASQP